MAYMREKKETINSHASNVKSMHLILFHACRLFIAISNIFYILCMYYVLKLYNNNTMKFCSEKETLEAIYFQFPARGDKLTLCK